MFDNNYSVEPTENTDWLTVMDKGRIYNDKKLNFPIKQIYNVALPLDCYVYCLMEKDCVAISMYEPPAELTCRLFNEVNETRVERMQTNAWSYIRAGSIKNNDLYNVEKRFTVKNVRLSHSTHQHIHVPPSGLKTDTDCWMKCKNNAQCIAATYKDPSNCFLYTTAYGYTVNFTDWSAYVKPKSVGLISPEPWPKTTTTAYTCDMRSESANGSMKKAIFDYLVLNFVLVNNIR
jgi:hypothetical protein